MREYYKDVINDALNDTQYLMKDAFQEFSIEIERLEEENEELKNRIQELEELLKIAKERD